MAALGVPPAMRVAAARAEGLRPGGVSGEAVPRRGRGDAAAPSSAAPGGRPAPGPARPPSAGSGRARARGGGWGAASARPSSSAEGKSGSGFQRPGSAAGRLQGGGDAEAVAPAKETKTPANVRRRAPGEPPDFIQNLVARAGGDGRAARGPSPAPPQGTAAPSAPPPASSEDGPAGAPSLGATPSSIEFYGRSVLVPTRRPIFMPVLKRTSSRGGGEGSQRPASAAAAVDGGRRPFGSGAPGRLKSQTMSGAGRPHSAREPGSSDGTSSRWARNFVSPGGAGGGLRGSGGGGGEAHGASSPPSSSTPVSTAHSRSSAPSRSRALEMGGGPNHHPSSGDPRAPHQDGAADIGISGVKYNDSARHYSRRLSESKILSEAIQGVTNSIPEKCSSISALNPQGDSLFQDLDGTVFSTTRDFPGVIIASRSPVAKRSCPDKINMVNKALGECCLLEDEHRLKSLSYKHNKIRRVGALQMQATPNLVLLDLGDNAVEDVSGLESLASLRILMLGKNALRSAAGLAGLKLDVLDLHDNRLEDTAGIEGQKALRVLNLSGNDLESLGDLSRLSYLVQLNARRNRLRCLGEVPSGPPPRPAEGEAETSEVGDSPPPPCPPLPTAASLLPASLERLYLSHNGFAGLSDFKCLGRMRHLSELALDGSPVCSEKNVRRYREAVLELCEHLTVLDMQNVREEERRLARNAKARREEQHRRNAALRGIRAAWERELEKRGVGEGRGAPAAGLAMLGAADDSPAASPRPGAEGDGDGPCRPPSAGMPTSGRDVVPRKGPVVPKEDAAGGGGPKPPAATAGTGGVPPLTSPSGQKSCLVEAAGRRLSLYGSSALSGAGQLAAQHANTSELHLQFIPFDAIPWATLARGMPGLRELSLEDNAMEHLGQLVALRPFAGCLQALSVGASNRATRLALFDPYALHVLPQLKQLNGRQVGADELDKARRSFDCMEDTLRKHASGTEEGATAGGHSDGAFAPAKADRFSKAAEDMLTSARLQACKTELLNSEWSAIIRSVIANASSIP